MTPEEINIAIAEACGWKNCKILNNRFGIRILGGEPPNNNLNHPWIDLPNYFNDLNACREMRKVLTDTQRLKFYQELVALLDRNPDGSHRYGACIYWETIDATPEQFCEAFLRTIGKWK